MEPPSGSGSWKKHKEKNQTNILRKKAPSTICANYEFTLKEDGIRYTQDWLIIAAGFALGKKIHGNFSFDLSFQTSPVIFCADKDEHLKTRETFVDYPRWGLFLEPAGRLSFTVQRFEFSLEIAHRYIVNARGKPI